MTILKLPHEGDTHTGHVTACGVEKGKYGEQVKFTFANGDVLYIGKVSADRQLLRAGFDTPGLVPPVVNYGAVGGHTLVFTRDPNADAPDKPYWGIQIASGTDPKPVTKRLPSPVPGDAPRTNPDGGAKAVARIVGGATGQTPAVRASREDVAAADLWALKTAADNVAALVATDPNGYVDCPWEPLQSHAARLFIALGQNGLIPGFAHLQLAGVKRTFDLPDPDPNDENLDEALPF